MKIKGINVNKTTLRTKLLVYILIPTILIFTATLVYIVLNTKDMAVENARSYVDATTRESANIVQGKFNSYMALLRTVAAVYHSYPEASKEQRKIVYDPILKDVLLENPQFISVWSNWELSALDKNYPFEHGRQRINTINDGGVVRVIEEHLETDGIPTQGLYYQLKANPREFMSEPYYFAYKGKEKDQILEASPIVPIIIDNKYAGQVGVDIEMNQFYDLIRDIKPFDGSYTMMISDQGTIISSPYPEYENKPKIG
ncbi:MAG: hypothetical protein WC341_02405, partial [Bacteroidales bacterium]